MQIKNLNKTLEQDYVIANKLIDCIELKKEYKEFSKTKKIFMLKNKMDFKQLEVKDLKDAYFKKDNPIILSKMEKDYVLRKLDKIDIDFNKDSREWQNARNDLYDNYIEPKSNAKLQEFKAINLLNKDGEVKTFKVEPLKIVWSLELNNRFDKFIDKVANLKDPIFTDKNENYSKSWVMGSDGKKYLKIKNEDGFSVAKSIELEKELIITELDLKDKKELNELFRYINKNEIELNDQSLEWSIEYIRKNLDNTGETSVLQVTNEYDLEIS